MTKKLKCWIGVGLLLCVAVMACDGGRGPLGGAPDGGASDAAARPDAGPPMRVDASVPRCRVTQCDDGRLASCDLELAIDCGLFGGVCAEAELEIDGVVEVAPWCSCGTLEEGFGVCAGGLLVACEGGAPQFFECVPGTECGIEDDLLDCYCLDEPDGICPGEACPADPDCATCTPSCGGAGCGDNGCGGTCGNCAVGETCEAGVCQPVCLPSCTPGTCNVDDGCGQPCRCNAGEACMAGICTTGCTPSCTPGACGDDGCGGVCTCPAGESCEAGLCAACVPDCSGGRVCGSDGCGGSCGTCAAGDSCNGQFDSSPDTRWCGCFFGDESVELDGTGAGLSDSSPILFVEVHYRSSPSPDGRPDSERPWNVRTLTEGEPIKTARYGDTCGPAFEVEVRYRGSGGTSCVIGPQRLTGVTNLVLPDTAAGCPATL